MVVIGSQDRVPFRTLPLHVTETETEALGDRPNLSEIKREAELVSRPPDLRVRYSTHL